jgi:hypothetical protein
VGFSRYKYGNSGRNSNQYSVLFGANADITDLIRGEVGIGYTQHSYASQAYTAVSGAALLARMEYFPTQLTTITFTAHRTPQNAIVLGSGGYFETGLGLRLDHELRRNILLKASVDYADQAYSGIARADHVSAVSVGGVYLLSHAVGVSSTLTWERRSSIGADHGVSFDDVKLMFSVVLQR